MKFRLVDRILSWTPHQRIRGIKTVSFEEYSLKEPFGDAGRLPETLLLESLLQLGNWLVLLSSDFRQMAMVVKLERVSFESALRPGEQAELEVHLLRGKEEGFVLSGEGRVQGRPLITGVGCLAVPVPAAEYLDPEDWRVLFSEIHQPEAAPS